MEPITFLLIAAAALIALSKSSGVSGVIKGVSTVTKQVGKAAAFVLAQYPNAHQLELETGISPTITLLQAAHESNFGLSGLAVKFHNLFGIKPSQAWLQAGRPLAHFDNVASENGASADFRAYRDDLESMRDWAEFLKTRFPLSYDAARRGDLDLFLDGLAKGKYGAYAGPTDGRDIPGYKKMVLALLPSIKGSLPQGIA